jgi:uncharacterized lipoprotein YmbA
VWLRSVTIDGDRATSRWSVQETGRRRDGGPYNNHGFYEDEMVKHDGSPEVKESHLTRAASDRSTDASVATLSETVADLSRQIAQYVIALASERERC